jgi:hypothetical protein
VRERFFTEFAAVNYDKDICDPACSLGQELEVPVYKFVKEALVKVWVRIGMPSSRQLLRSIKIIQNRIKNLVFFFKKSYILRYFYIIF